VPGSMLLCLVKGRDVFADFNSGVWNGVLAGDGWGCGQDREGPLRVEGKLL